MNILLAICLLLFGGFLQSPGAPPTTNPCSTCNGTGKAVQECLACFGRGDLPCVVCGEKIFDPRAVLERDATLTIEQREELAKARRERWVVLPPNARLQGRPAKPGHVECPALCVDGSRFLTPSVECAYCGGKGSFACVACAKKGSVKCINCKGKKRLERACEDCAGTGLRVGAAAIAREARAVCSWCDGSSSRVCVDCDEHGTIDQGCATCLGERTRACHKCLGLKDDPCTRCGGTGQVDAFVDHRRGTRPCTACGAKGRVRCTNCTQGVVRCDACDARADFRAKCHSCLGHRKSVCRGCFLDGFRSWELAGEELLAAGDREGARAFFEIALSRVESHFQQLERITLRPANQKPVSNRAEKEARTKLTQRIALTKKVP